MRCDLSRSASYQREGYTWEEDVAEVRFRRGSRNAGTIYKVPGSDAGSLAVVAGYTICKPRSVYQRLH